MNIKIRSAVIDDYTSLCDIYSELDELHRVTHPELFVKANNYCRSQDYVIKLIDNPDNSLLVAEIDSKLIGLAECYIVQSPSFPIIKERKWVQLDSIAVKKEYQKHNIGSMLLNEVINWAKNKNIFRVELKVYNFNDSAVKFYQSKGFKDLNRTMFLNL